MGPVTNEQSGSIYITLTKLVYLTEEHSWVNHHAVTNNASGMGRKNANRDEVELKLTLGVDHGVTGVITTRKTDYYVCLLSKQVNNLTFPLIPPLTTNDNNSWHSSLIYCFPSVAFFPLIYSTNSTRNKQSRSHFGEISIRKICAISLRVLK
jgi:hypothetical protein